MNKLLLFVLAGIVFLTAGCGKTAPAESDPKEPADADAQNETVFEDENALPKLMAVSDGVFYTMTGLYGEDDYRLSVSEAVDEQNFVYETKGVGIWYLYADGDHAAWAEWDDSGYEYKIYDRKNDEVRTFESVKTVEDEDQNKQMGFCDGRLYYTLDDYKAGKTSILCYDPASDKKETLYEAGLSENGFALSVNNGVLTAYVGESEGTRQQLVQIDLKSGEKKEIEVPGDLDSLYAVSYDNGNDLIALYYHAEGSETEDIGTFTPGDKEIKSLYSMPENLYAYRDRIDIKDGTLYWVTQVNASGVIADHYTLTVYDCKKDRPKQYKSSFGYALADDGLYILSFREVQSVVTVKRVE